MRRITQLVLAVLVAVGISITALLPPQTPETHALDFWSWDGSHLSDGDRNYSKDGGKNKGANESGAQDPGGARGRRGR